MFAPFENRISQLECRRSTKKKKSTFVAHPYSIRIRNRIEQRSMASDLSSLQWTENPVSHMVNKKNCAFRISEMTYNKRQTRRRTSNLNPQYPFFLYSLEIIINLDFWAQQKDEHIIYCILSVLRLLFLHAIRYQMPIRYVRIVCAHCALCIWCDSGWTMEICWIQKGITKIYG